MALKKYKGLWAYTFPNPRSPNEPKHIYLISLLYCISTSLSSYKCRLYSKRKRLELHRSVNEVRRERERDEHRHNCFGQAGIPSDRSEPSIHQDRRQLQHPRLPPPDYHLRRFRHRRLPLRYSLSFSVLIDINTNICNTCFDCQFYLKAKWV